MKAISTSWLNYFKERKIPWLYKQLETYLTLPVCRISLGRRNRERDEPLRAFSELFLLKVVSYSFQTYYIG